MLRIEYTQDDIEKQLNKSFDEVLQLPQSVLLHYCLKKEYLTPNDLIVARSPDYHTLVKKYSSLDELSYANTVFQQFKLKLFLISAVCAFFGLYYAVSNIFIFERVGSYTHYIFILFLILEAGYYYLSITILEIKMIQAWKNRLQFSGRLLFPTELTSGLSIKYIISAIISQLMIIIILDASITLIFGN